MKKILLTLLVGLFALSFVSANTGCNVHYNMHHQVPTPALPAAPILLPQHIVNSDCCNNAPVYNNYQLPKKIVVNNPTLNQQHIVKSNCCGNAPVYNNYQQPQPVITQPIVLNQFHYVNKCTSCNP